MSRGSRTVTSRKNAYVKQTSARAHYETRLIKVSRTRSTIVWLAIGQVRPRIRHVYHRRKTGVPRSKLLGGHLRHAREL
jgi:hypothetical protein